MNEKYEAIINLPHQISKKRQQMSRSDRAAQFAPYSALSGYEDAVEETARLTDSPVELDEYEKEKINASLTYLLSAPPDTLAEITYFRPDKYKSGGAYVTACAEIGHIDEVERQITLTNGLIIKIDSIYEVKITDNSQQNRTI